MVCSKLIPRERSISRLAAIEPLERRQLLHGDLPDFHVQFGPTRITPPDAYVLDSGQACAARGDGSLSYGWSQNRAAKPVVRRATPLAPDERYNSFVVVKRRGASWELAVPNGSYLVHLVAGDAKAKKGSYGFDVEGVPALRGQATRDQRWIEAAVSVNVTDGLLTISSPAEFRRNKLNFIDITPEDATPNTGSSEEAPAPLGMPNAAGFIPLFNGSDLSGFYTFIDGQGPRNDPRRLFAVENGMIHILGSPDPSRWQPYGYLATETRFSDYHLRLEYQWGEKKFPPRDGDDTPRDSGLLFHVHGRDTVWPASVEAQIQEGDTGDIWLLSPNTISASTTVVSDSESPPTYREDGEATTVSNNRIIKSNTVDSLTDWNTVEVIAQGDAAVVIVNGEVVNRVTRIRDHNGNPLRSGKIALQLEGAEIWYRNIELKPLSSYGFGAAPPAGAVVLTDAPDAARFVHRQDAQPLQWDVENGVMTVRPDTGDIRSIDSFTDYHLHLEFQVPVTDPGGGEQDRGNSGVGLAGSYELQILDSFGRTLADANDLGAIYGVRDAAANAALPAGVWQTYDISFAAPRFENGVKVANARITARLNGTVIHDNVEVPAATFTFEPEAEGPRPIILQDHGNHVRFRNIWVLPQST